MITMIKSQMYFYIRIFFGFFLSEFIFGNIFFHAFHFFLLRPCMTGRKFFKSSIGLRHSFQYYFFHNATINTENGDPNQMGQRDGMSELDMQKLNNAHTCTRHPTTQFYDPAYRFN